MRTIKFRGYDKGSGLWRYGLLLVDGEKYYIAQIIQGKLVKWLVDPNSIGQFTGLKDKNGKEIYEGDIIRSFDSTGLAIIHSIVWLESCAKFVAQLDSDSKYGRTCCDLDKDWIDEFCKKVIGNRWDNPELLKGGEK